ncbi:hypothetical protein [Marinovum sp.]|uniref:hypothetical protein n=1 Tax=Marinovum sp. TaxID=2024839 RepID=UPI003A9476A0
MLKQLIGLPPPATFSVMMFQNAPEDLDSRRVAMPGDDRAVIELFFKLHPAQIT